MKETELNALVRLLDDPDEEISGMVEQQLLDLGTSVVGKLELAWEESFNVFVQQRLESIIHRIQFQTVSEMLAAWVRDGAHDLLEGVLIVNRYQYPDLKKEHIEKQLDDFAFEIGKQVVEDGSNAVSAAENIRLFNRVFYQQFKFGGNTSNYQDPQNSYLNLVLESRKGNQISLAIVYSLIARKLGMPVFGVNLPQHFVLAYSAAPLSEVIPYEEPVYFYINAFNKGLIFYNKEIELFLKQLNLARKAEYYNPCSNTAIVLRILRNLIGSYGKLGSEEKINELSVLLGVLQENKPSLDQDVPESFTPPDGV